MQVALEVHSFCLLVVFSRPWLSRTELTQRKDKAGTPEAPPFQPRPFPRQETLLLLDSCMSLRERHTTIQLPLQ